MARSKSTFLIYAEYIPLRAFFALLGALPLSLSMSAGRLLAKTLYLFLPARRRLVKANLALSFPALDEAARARIARESLDHLGREIGIFPHIPRLARNGFQNTVDLVGYEHVEAALQKGRGILCFTGHYGIWEMIAGYAPTLLSPAGMVVRPLDNPKLEAMVLRVRSCTGGIVVSRNNIFREGLRILRKNGMLGLLVDQNTAKGGVFVNFFGRLAATTTVMSLLARRTGAPVITLRSLWAGNKIRMVFGPPMELSNNPDLELAQAEDTQRMTSVIEDWVRAEPGQWLWLHNRWKRRPIEGDFIYPGASEAPRPAP